MWEVKVSRPDQSGVMRHHSTIKRDALIELRDAREGLEGFASPGSIKPVFTSVCNFCKKEFKSMKKDQMFCPPKIMMRKECCAYLFNKEKRKKPILEKVCKACKKTYKTRLPPQIFCRNPCAANSLKLIRQKCSCGGNFRTHRDEIKTCTKCRGTDKKYASRI